MDSITREKIVLLGGGQFDPTLGGHFHPTKGGQFKTTLGGQFQPTLGGQFGRHLHYPGNAISDRNLATICRTL